MPKKQAQPLSTAPAIPTARLSPDLAELLSRLTALERLPTATDAAGQEDTDAMDQRADAMRDLMLSIIRTRCDGPCDVALKLTLLCRRLRQELEPEDVEMWQTYLLAESVRDGVVMGH